MQQIAISGVGGQYNLGAEILRAPATVTVPTTDPDGCYVVSWAPVTTSGVLYLLEEATSTDFRGGLRTAYYGTALSKQITGRSAGTTYYYRVKTVKPGAVDSARRLADSGCVVGP